MNLEEFVNKIFNRYPPEIVGNDTYESRLVDFLNALDDGGKYNYDNAFIDLTRSYSFKTTPAAKLVIELLKKNEIKKLIDNKAAECKETILADAFGISYEFALDCPFGIARTNLEKRGLTNIRLKEPVVRSFG